MISVKDLNIFEIFWVRVWLIIFILFVICDNILLILCLLKKLSGNVLILLVRFECIL